MAKTLAEKISDSRQSEVTVDSITFQIRLATAEELCAYARDVLTDPEISRKHICGWSGVKESDLLEGGSSDLVPFDKSLFDTVIADHQEWWTYIADAVIRKAKERLEMRAESKKK